MPAWFNNSTRETSRASSAEYHVLYFRRGQLVPQSGVKASAGLRVVSLTFKQHQHRASYLRQLHTCHRSLENQPRKVELIRPLSLHKRNKHFHSKKLHSRALRGVFWNENANLRKLTGWFDSTLAGRFVVTADTIRYTGTSIESRTPADTERHTTFQTAIANESHITFIFHRSYYYSGIRGIRQKVFCISHFAQLSGFAQTERRF
jgi:hypothetical protein